MLLVGQSVENVSRVRKLAVPFHAQECRAADRVSVQARALV